MILARECQIKGKKDICRLISVLESRGNLRVFATTEINYRPIKKKEKKKTGKKKEKNIVYLLACSQVVMVSCPAQLTLVS